MLAKTNIIKTLIKITFRFMPFKNSFVMPEIILGIKLLKTGSTLPDLDAEFVIANIKTTKINNKIILLMSFLSIFTNCFEKHKAPRQLGLRPISVSRYDPTKSR